MIKRKIKRAISIFSNEWVFTPSFYHIDAPERQENTLIETAVSVNIPQKDLSAERAKRKGKDTRGWIHGESKGIRNAKQKNSLNSEQN